jgi:hypothetical protein
MVRSDRRHTIRDKTNPGRPDLLDNLVGLPSSSKLMSESRGCLVYHFKRDAEYSARVLATVFALCTIHDP